MAELADVSDKRALVWGLRADVVRLGLRRHPDFDTLTPDELASIYNGIGPDSWSPELRSAMTWFYRNFQVLPLVHDVDFHFSDGSYAGWLQSTRNWWVNGRAALADRYPLTKPWLLPLRVLADRKLKLSYAALALGSRGAWDAAHKAKLARYAKH